jgi:hypothetical protein
VFSFLAIDYSFKGPIKLFQLFSSRYFSFFKKYADQFNLSIFLLTFYFFDIFSFTLFGLNLHLGFLGVFLIFLNFFLFGNGLNKKIKNVAIILGLLIISNLAIGFSMPCELLHKKMVISSFIYYISFIVVFNLGLNFKKIYDEVHIVNFSNVLLIISIFAIFIQFLLSNHSFFDFHGRYLVWSPVHNSYDAFNPRMPGFFGEPSLLAIKIIMLYILILLRGTIYDLLLIFISALIILWFSFSVTFLVLFALVLLLYFFKHLFLYNSPRHFFSIIIILFGIIISTDFISILSGSPYIYSRVSFLFDTSFYSLSYSGLVYVQSWLDTYGNLHNTSLLGTGFNQDTCFPRFPGIILELASTYPNPIHELSGGNVFLAKFISEWGIIGLFLLLLLILKFIDELKIKEYDLFSLKLTLSFIVIFFIASIRSSTYYHFILFPFLLAVFLNYKKALIIK